MSLGGFLGDQSLGSWADEVEDMPATGGGGRGGGGAGYGGDRHAFISSDGYGSNLRFDRGDRGFTHEQLPLPTKPRYTAYFGNLSFDATEGDITDSFADCAIINVRIIKDKLNRNPKDFEYIKFAILDGLEKALELLGTRFRGRNVRISVAKSPKNRLEARNMFD